MTVEEARKEIIESGIELGAGDYVDIEALEVAAKALEKVQQYEAIGTIERFRELTEKAEPKNVFVEGSYLLDDVRYLCPKCKERLYKEHFYVGYCNCGQAVKR